MNIEIKKIDFKLKMLLSIIIYLAILSLILIFLVFPSIKYIKNTSNDIINQKVDLEKYSMSKKELKDAEIKLNLSKDKIANISEYFVDKNNELDFIKTLEDLSTKYKVEQKISIDYNSLNNTEVYNSVPVQITIFGNFQDVLDYISELNTINYFINIKSISFLKMAGNSPVGRPVFDASSSTQSPQVNLIEAIIKLNSYWK